METILKLHRLAASMRRTEVSDNVLLELPKVDSQTADCMRNDIASLVQRICLTNVKAGALLSVKTTPNWLYFPSYEITPVNCDISGYDLANDKEQPFLIEREEKKFKGGVKISGNALLIGRIDVTIYYKPIIECTYRVIE